MRLPVFPPNLDQIFERICEKDPKRFQKIFSVPSGHDKYLHWDEMRHRPVPNGLTHEEWWYVTKMSRLDALKPIPLADKKGDLFLLGTPDLVMEDLHKIDMGCGGAISIPEPITNPHTRDRYVVNSLIQEAITSSQLEGAVTTREVAKEMIRSGREPRDKSEKMILNNYMTMRHIQKIKSEKLTPDLVFEIHRLVTEDTLEDEAAAGRFRNRGANVVVGDDYGEIFHEPPSADELPKRMEAMCAFANNETPDYFVHPAVRAIILHFWLAYDHPFVDGNGRTARALFYWSMLHQGYWLFEFISISTILRNAPAKYGKSFLYTETDENDLTYFLLAQLKVIRRAIEELQTYIKRKTDEMRLVESQVKALRIFNHRQSALISHALKHPGHRYTFSSHQESHGISYQTARTDLLKLVECGVLKRRDAGAQIVFVADKNLSEKLEKIEKRGLRSKRR